MSLEIRYAPWVNLSPAELALLTQSFADSQEIFVERELHAGFSGARVLLVQPGSHLAQVVVKLGPPADLHQEWEAYQALVKDFSPQNTARIQSEPLLSNDGQRALLRYTFAGGDPRLPTRSLKAYYQEQGASAAAEVLNRVIRVYGRQWWSHHTTHKFTLSEAYDGLLPVHLKLKISSNLESTSPTLAAGEVNALTLRALSPGDRVRLLNFTVSEARPNRRDITLTAPPPTGEASAALRLRVEGVDPALYHPGDRVAALNVVVTTTRHHILAEVARTAMSNLNPDAPEVNLGGMICPNPLYDYTDLLDEVTEARFSIIHGDLNLENILVDSATGFAWLIDFADTRRGPALFDLQRLEAQVITRLLAPAADQAGLEPIVMMKVYHALHAELPDATAPYPALQEPYTLLVAIRRLARQFLMNDMAWDEYYRGLILTLLGALKFAELETTTRALLLAGAAAARALMDKPVPTFAKPKSTPTWRRPVIIATISLFLGLMVMGAVGLWWRQPKPTDNPLALIANLAGRVEIRRHLDDQVQLAAFGLDLFQDDAVLTFEEGMVVVLCNNGLLLGAGPKQVLIVHCQDTGDAQTLGRLDPRLSMPLVQTSQALTITLAPTNRRAGRADFDRAPTLIGPRNTAITELRPTWRWTEVVGAQAYRLTLVNAVAGERWQAETTATELTYPADAPPLIPDTVYLTQLAALGPAGQVDESFFFILDEAKQNEVAAATQAIQALSLDPAAAGFLLAKNYQAWELWEAAITQLEAISSVAERPELTHQLGDLYFQVGLYLQAEQNYQAALAAAQAAQNPPAQAEALVGLGRVAEAYGEVETAISHFQAAETLFRAAGNIGRAEAVAQVLAQLALNPKTVPPSSSPTP